MDSNDRSVDASASGDIVARRQTAVEREEQCGDERTCEHKVADDGHQGLTATWRKRECAASRFSTVHRACGAAMNAAPACPFLLYRNVCRFFPFCCWEQLIGGEENAHFDSLGRARHPGRRRRRLSHRTHALNAKAPVSMTEETGAAAHLTARLKRRLRGPGFFILIAAVAVVAARMRACNLLHTLILDKPNPASARFGTHALRPLRGTWSASDHALPHVLLL